MTETGCYQKPRRIRLQERGQTKGLISRRMAMQVRYKSLYISSGPMQISNVK